MSAELQSMLRFQASRLAAGRVDAGEMAYLAKTYLELERASRLSDLSERERRAIVKASLRVLPAVNPETNA